MTDKAKKYIQAVESATGTKLNDHTIPHYSGHEGHKRYFRELGYALNDFSEPDRNEIPQLFYGVYVKLCSLKPLLDMKKMTEIMNSQIVNERIIIK